MSRQRPQVQDSRLKVMLKADAVEPALFPLSWHVPSDKWCNGNTAFWRKTLENSYGDHLESDWRPLPCLFLDIPPSLIPERSVVTF